MEDGKKDLDRRGFVKTAVAGAATMVVGGMMGARDASASAPFKWGQELDTRFVELLGSYGAKVKGNARKLTKRDVINLRLYDIHAKDAKLNERIRNLSVDEIRSIEDVIDEWHRDILCGKVGMGYGPLDNTCYDESDCSSSCCCCTPCCCCAAANTDTER